MAVSSALAASASSTRDVAGPVVSRWPRCARRRSASARSHAWRGCDADQAPGHQGFAGVAEAARRRLLALSALVLVVQRDATAWGHVARLAEALRQAARESGEIVTPDEAQAARQPSVTFSDGDAYELYMCGSGDELEDEDESGEVARRQELFSRDTANTCPIVQSVRSALAALGDQPALVPLASVI